MNKLEGLKIGLRTIAGISTVWAASQIADGKVSESIQAQEIKPQNSQNRILNQEYCPQAETLYKKPDGTIFRNNIGCPPKEGGPYQRLDPNGVVLIPHVQTGQTGPAK